MSLSMADIALQPAEGSQYIMKRAEHVSVSADKCKEVAALIMDDLVDGKIEAIDYKSNPLHPSDLSLEGELLWLYMLDTLNFSFWPEDGEKYEVTYNGKTEVGYLALCAAIRKAYDSGIPIMHPDHQLKMTHQDLDTLLKSDSGHPIPMSWERWQFMHEGAKFLQKHHKSSYLTFVQKNNGSAQTLLRAIITIESFRDQIGYKGRMIWFLKRAQILVSDTYSYLKDSSISFIVDWQDMDTLTMFADYRVPQVLNYFACMEYSEALMDKLRDNHKFEYGDEEECEIRGASIFCVQEIYAEVKKLRADRYRDTDYTDKRAILPVDIDVWLWQYRRDHADEVESIVPFHRCRNPYY